MTAINLAAGSLVIVALAEAGLKPKSVSDARIIGLVEDWVMGRITRVEFVGRCRAFIQWQ